VLDDPTKGPETFLLDALIQKPQHFPGPPGLPETSDLQKMKRKERNDLHRSVLIPVKT